MATPERMSLQRQLEVVPNGFWEFISAMEYQTDKADAAMTKLSGDHFAQLAMDAARVIDCQERLRYDADSTEIRVSLECAIDRMRTTVQAINNSVIREVTK